MFWKDRMYPRFALYGFLKNLRFFDPFIVLIFRAAGLTYLEIGFLYAIRDVSTNIMEIPTGVFADAFGRRKAMLMAFGSYILSFIIFYSFSSFWLYAAAMILFSFGEAFRTGTHKALILEYLKLNQMTDLKVAYYGRTRAASQFGSAINALVAAGLVFWTGAYRTMFLVAIIPYVLDFFNLLTYPPELDGDLSQLRLDEIGAQVRATLQDFVSLFTDVRAMKAIFNSAGFDALFKASKDYLQPILETFALSLPIFLTLNDMRRSALVIGVVYFIIYLFTSYASRSADGFSRRFTSLGRAINLSFLLGAALLVVAGLSTWGEWTLVAIIVFLAFYVLHNLRRPMNVAYISDQIASRVMASGLSVESQVKTLFAAGFAPLLGWMADAWGVGPALAALGCFVLLLYGLVRVDETPAAA